MRSELIADENLRDAARSSQRTAHSLSDLERSERSEAHPGHGVSNARVLIQVLDGSCRVHRAQRVRGERKEANIAASNESRRGVWRGERGEREGVPMAAMAGQRS